MIPQPQPHPDVSLWLGDALEVLAVLPDEFVDAVVTDPPYELGFMGRHWDRSGIAYNVELWKHCLRVLKPGGHLLAFGGTRTYHRLTCAIEDAGFEIRDEIAWLYGSGFPKSLDVSKAIDRAAGAVREVIGDGQPFGRGSMRNRSRVEQGYRPTEVNPDGGSATLTAPATDDAARWSGWGTALKPAHEPIVVARKPLAGTIAANVLAHGTGALNIDGCRVEGAPRTTHADGNHQGTAPQPMSWGESSGYFSPNAVGRWPSNVVLDEYAAAELDRQSGNLRARGNIAPTRRETAIWGNTGPSSGPIDSGDSGGASRFFPVFRYQAKAPTRERPKVDGVAHPTVKPLELMRWLVRLVAPPGALILEPFAGSGTTAEACIAEGMRCVAIEREATYLPLIRNRLTDGS